MKKSSIVLSITVASLLMVGCGGGSSSEPTSTSTATLSGTVPGTLIEAFCDNGYYAQVSSTQNGTSEHPFEIEVPTNTNCRLVMTTNENDPDNRIITLIGFTNGSTIVLEQDVNLGNIPLEIEYENADDKDGDHVVDTELIVDPNGASTNDDHVQDDNNNDLVDSYDDDDDDNIVNAYEDDDDDGIENIHDDDDDHDDDENNDDDNDDDHEDDDHDDEEEDSGVGHSGYSGASGDSGCRRGGPLCL